MPPPLSSQWLQRLNVNHRSHSSTGHKPRDYARTPLNIYWEMTQACALACRHCRARAADPNPQDLTSEEGVGFLRQIPNLVRPCLN